MEKVDPRAMRLFQRMLEKTLMKGQAEFPQAFNAKAIPPQKLSGNRRWKHGRRYENKD